MTDLHASPLDAGTFDEMIAVHGADLSRWPLDVVKPALALMAADDAARQRFDDARQMDDDLRLADDQLHRHLRARHGETCQALQDNVMRRLRGEDVPRTPSPAVIAATASAPGLRRFFAPLGSLLIVGVIGFVMGVQQPASASDSLLDGLVHGQDIVIAGDQSLTGGM